MTSCHPSQNHYVHPRFSGGDLDQSQSPQNFYHQPPQTNLARHETHEMLRQRGGEFMRRSNFEQPTIVENNLKSRFYFRPDDYSDDECADPNAKIQHFQYPARPTIDENQMINSFQSSYIDTTLTKFNHSNQQELTRILPKIQQTFLFNNDVTETEEDETSNQKTFRSHTRIKNIPNGGFQIITEIYRDDENEEKVLESEEANSNSDESMNPTKSNESAKLDGNWLGKSIETTGDGSSCEILTDDADEAGENL